MIDAEFVAGQLGGRPSTDGWWLCYAPCHEDNSPSFCVKDDDDNPGKIRTQCHAGCAGPKKAAALKAMGLWPGREPNDQAIREFHARAVAPKKARDNSADFIFPVPEDAQFPWPKKAGIPADKVWFFRDKQGRILTAHSRWNSHPAKDGGKDFAWHGYHREKGWVWSRPTILPAPIYGLSDLAPDEIPVICEGEKTADAISEIPGYRGLTCGSKAEMGKADWTFLSECPLVIFAPDRGDESAILNLQDQISGPEIRVVFGPDDAPKGWDLADCSEHDRADFLRGSSLIPDQKKEVIKPEQIAPEPERVPCMVETNERVALDLSLSVLARDRALGLYCRAGKIVDVDPSGDVQNLVPSQVRIHISERIKFIGKSGDPVKVPTSLPGAVLEWGKYPEFPELRGIVRYPCIMPGGRVLDRPGYDKETRNLFVDTGRSFPPVPANPTQDDARQAARELMDDFRDFPFQDECDKAAFLAYTLTIFCRDAINGFVPSFINTANEQGAGKSLLMTAPWKIANGREPGIKSGLPHNPDELAKVVVASLLRGDRSILFDNVTTRIRGDALALLVTAEYYQCRILGESTQMEFRNNWIVAFTSNNPSVDMDQISRSVFIRLQAPAGNKTRPESAYKHANLKEYLNGATINATRAVTILRAFYLAGLPNQGQRAMRDFHDWVKVVSGAVMFAGFPDPLTAHDEASEEADTESESWVLLLDLVSNLQIYHGTRGITVLSICEQAESSPRLHTALQSVVGSKQKVNPTTVGNAFRKAKGRHLGGFKLLPGGRAASGNFWIIEGAPEKAGQKSFVEEDAPW